MNQTISPSEWRALHSRHPGKFAKSGGARKRRQPGPINVPADVECVLAIDPAIGNLGWAVIGTSSGLASADIYRYTSGTWSPSSAKGKPDRWQQLWAFIRSLKESYPQIDAAVVEVPNTAGLARGKPFAAVAHIAYGRAVGIVHAALLESVGRVLTPAVEQWKGRGNKSNTMAVVSARLGYQPKDDNEADALGLGLWVLDQAVERRETSP